MCTMFVLGLPWQMAEFIGTTRTGQLLDILSFE
jgi:hypothetical protein